MTAKVAGQGSGRGPGWLETGVQVSLLSHQWQIQYDEETLWDEDCLNGSIGKLRLGMLSQDMLLF